MLLAPIENPATEHEELVRLFVRDLFRKLLPKFRDDFFRGLLSLAYLCLLVDDGLALTFAAKKEHAMFARRHPCDMRLDQ
jgi:hypothetical protein